MHKCVIIGGSMRKTNKGFTIIELMIVISIMGILASIIIPAYTEFKAEKDASVLQVPQKLQPRELLQQDQKGVTVKML